VYFPFNSVTRLGFNFANHSRLIDQKGIELKTLRVRRRRDCFRPPVRGRAQLQEAAL
jgi:hypothetical protein